MTYTDFTKEISLNKVFYSDDAIIIYYTSDLNTYYLFLSQPATIEGITPGLLYYSVTTLYEKLPNIFDIQIKLELENIYFKVITKPTEVVTN